MNPMKESSCPLCRQSFSNFPSICLTLHNFLVKSFPSLYQQRAKDFPEESQLLRTKTSIQKDTTQQQQQQQGNEQEEENQSEQYVHSCVGCDNCGQYPIIGRRFKCRECEDHMMGFDLCQKCFFKQSETKEIIGKFNQRHESSHLMFEVSPPPTIFPQIFQYLLHRQSNNSS